MNTAPRDSDRRWMRRAFELALRGRYGTSPNPMVGAVVVNAEDQLVGEGYHALFGGPHAEVVALRAAGELARGGSLYVTLEPCAHFGKTPPCVDAIVASGVRRVVIAMRDPTTMAGGGVEKLEAEGIDVTVSRDTNGARALNRRWLKWVEERRPWVTMKAAVSLDGRIATRSGQSKWITGEPARRRGLELREEHDAILVGVKTVILDDPRLTQRLEKNRDSRWRRVVLDSRLRTPSEATVVVSEPELTIIVHTPSASDDNRRRLEAAGVTLLEIPPDAAGKVELQPMLESLARLDVAALLVEGGATVHGAFADGGFVDEAVFFVAPIVIGGTAPAAVAGRGVADLERAHRLRFENVVRHGEDLELHAVRREDPDVHGPD